MTSTPPFRLRGGVVVLGSNTVLDGVDFQLSAGEVVAVLGDNGAGKSTLVKALLRLVALRGGSLEIFDTPAQRFRQWHRIGYVPQRFTATSGVPATVEEVVASGLVSHGGVLRPRRRGQRERVLRALAEVNLEHRLRDPVDRLSGGQQQRTLIARSLVGEPDVLVLDEPVAGVDQESQSAFARTMARVKQQGRSVLLVAHGLGAVRSLVDRVFVLHGGRVAYEGDPLPDPHAHHDDEAHHPDEDLGGRRFR